ncbi:MAG: hypothetical protein NC931_01765, partial [Candidatus Omnitrophica bacterium]|nr:hypothetical protein [Candidatus Omnitrophota bacterium]
MSSDKKLSELSQHFLFSDIPEDFSDIVKNELNLDIWAKYGNLELKNPVIVAPGQMTTSILQLHLIKQAGFAGCVLKSVVAEDKNQRCSMKILRKKPTKVETVYDETDD